MADDGGFVVGLLESIYLAFYLLTYTIFNRTVVSIHVSNKTVMSPISLINGLW